jgi:hypothetical protein
VRRAFVVSIVIAWVAAVATEAHADGDLPGDEPSSDPPLRPDDPRSHIQARVALTGEYRSLYDLSVLGGGVTLSVGGDGDKSGQVNLRLVDGRTVGGLHVLDMGLGGSAEFVVTGGLLVGLGGGLALFGVQRATDGSQILSVGPELYGRIGYRFANRDAPFLTLDLGSELQTNGTLVWGPTLSLGYRF